MVRNKNAILVADHHPLCRQGLTTLFVRSLRISSIHEACDFPAVMARVGSNTAIGLVTIDLGLPGLRKSEGLRDLRVRFPEVRVVVIAASRDRDHVLDALAAGVHGYIPKDSSVDDMTDALRTVLAGQMYVPLLVSDLTARKQHMAADDSVTHDAVLTDRQFEVLNLLAKGCSNKEIARLLRITEGTVKVHVAAAFRMLGVHNRVGAAAAMRERALNHRSIGPYLPSRYEEPCKAPILRPDHNRLAQIVHRR